VVPESRVHRRPHFVEHTMNGQLPLAFRLQKGDHSLASGARCLRGGPKHEQLNKATGSQFGDAGESAYSQGGILQRTEDVDRK
jgi:hypothetical protein